MLLAFLLSWLSGLPVGERLARYARLHFDAVCQLLLGPDNEPRDLSPIDLFRAEACLRRAHALLDLAIWVEARARASLPHRRGVRAARFCFASRLPDRDALIVRTLEFARRMRRIHFAAARWAERMRKDPLRLDAPHRATSPGIAGGGKKMAVAGIASPTHVGEVSCARLRAQDGGGLSIRAPPRPSLFASR